MDNAWHGCCIWNISRSNVSLGVKFLEAVVNRYSQMDEYWILARRKERLDKLAGKYKNKKVTFANRFF